MSLKYLKIGETTKTIPFIFFIYLIFVHFIVKKNIQILFFLSRVSEDFIRDNSNMLNHDFPINIREH